MRRGSEAEKHVNYEVLLPSVVLNTPYVAQ